MGTLLLLREAAASGCVASAEFVELTGLHEVDVADGCLVLFSILAIGTETTC